VDSFGTGKIRVKLFLPSCKIWLVGRVPCSGAGSL